MIFAATDLRQFLRFVFCRIREKSDVEINAVPRVFFSVHRVARVQNADGHTAHHTANQLHMHMHSARAAFDINLCFDSYHCCTAYHSEHSVCVFLFLYVFNIFFCHCSLRLSVCLVLWASLPEIKIDDDDDN